MKKRNISIICSTIMVVFLLFSSLLVVNARGESKKLYFVEEDKVMTWDPVKGDDGNWFMRFLDMIPGVTYTDSLDIENGTSKTYELYLQLLPVYQTEIQDALLKLINMSVYLDGNLLYSGTAMGSRTDGGIGVLEKLVPIGTYFPGTESEITVILSLDKSVTIEHSNLLTNIDWKFLALEKTSVNLKEPEEIAPPSTGDAFNIVYYVVISAIMLSLLIIILFGKKKKKVNL